MSCNCRKCREQREEVITDPTRTVVNTRTNRRVVKHIHPTEVINVNRTVVRNEHYYPVYERDVYETVEKTSIVAVTRIIIADADHFGIDE
ncbi:CotD family spore coat protein [Peribacillus sp. SI8-4]|uniref:CotD family spore coat protein n=1 Tax=Peribacillus sp. SI8-4 TaxID=3048009 RepID=UPI00255749B3|nr:CotD family spore coat protein [Peribacillus sp. SI8-4]